MEALFSSAPGDQEYEVIVADARSKCRKQPGTNRPGSIVVAGRTVASVPAAFSTPEICWVEELTKANMNLQCGFFEQLDLTTMEAGVKARYVGEVNNKNPVGRTTPTVSRTSPDPQQRSNHNRTPQIRQTVVEGYVWGKTVP